MENVNIANINLSNGNIANGGLVVQHQGGAVFAQPNEWFLNSDDEFIYYSDRGDNNRIYRKSGANGERKLVLKEPCSFVTLYEDGIYYVSEDRMKVYRCSKEGKGRAQCSGESVSEFGILDYGGVYLNPRARRLCVCGHSAYYADAENNYALTIIDTRGAGGPRVYPDVKPSHINVHNGYVYYTDRMRGNALYRLDPYGVRHTIYGDAAESLHIIDDWLYFISGRKWRWLSLLDYGEAEEVS